MIDYDKQKLPQFIIDGLKPIIEAQKKINDIILELMPEYLIAKEELTQPEPKYKVGQEVFLHSDNEVYSFIIKDIVDDGHYLYLEGGNWEVYEDELYPTKSQLIEAQIEYWRSQLGKREECEHIGNIKCIKCGEFYR